MIKINEDSLFTSKDVFILSSVFFIIFLFVWFVFWLTGLEFQRGGELAGTFILSIIVPFVFIGLCVHARFESYHEEQRYQKALEGFYMDEIKKMSVDLESWKEQSAKHAEYAEKLRCELAELRGDL